MNNWVSKYHFEYYEKNKELILNKSKKKYKENDIIKNKNLERWRINKIQLLEERRLLNIKNKKNLNIYYINPIPKRKNTFTNGTYIISFK